MKTLKILFLIAVTALVAVSCTQNIAKSRAIDNTRVAVFYSSDDANQIAGAAVYSVRYNYCSLFDIDNMTTGNQLTAIQTITDSVHKVVLLCDTATAWATNKITGAQYDSLVERLYTDTAYGVAPDAAIVYHQASATKNKAEVAWAAVYPSLTTPKVIEYLGDDIYSSLVTRSKKVNTDSTAVDSTNTLVADAYIGDWAVIYDGTGIGQSRQVYDNSTSAFYVAPDWAKKPDQTSLIKIIKEGDSNEILYDMYTALYVLSQLRDVSAKAVEWHKLLDKNYLINDGAKKDYQDLDYLHNTVLFGGKLIYDYGVFQGDY